MKSSPKAMKIFTILLVVLAGSAEAFAPPPHAPTHAPVDANFRAPWLHFGNTRTWMADRDAGGERKRAARNYTHSTMQVTGKGALWDDYELDTRLIKVGPATLSALRPSPQHDTAARHKVCRRVTWARWGRADTTATSGRRTPWAAAL
jgi:hypothetical protein